MQFRMLLGRFEKMRRHIIERVGIVPMAHIGPSAFDTIGGEVANVTTAVLYSVPLSDEVSYVV